MNKDTYEFENTNRALERYEWDDVWRIEAYDLNAPRLFSIGDSISRGYRHYLADKFHDIMCVDNYATSKAIDNPMLLKTIHLLLEQLGNCRVILFNSGLHGGHLNIEAYKKYYDAAICELRTKHPAIKIVIALSTPVDKKGGIALYDEAKRNLINSKIINKNKAAVSVAEKYGLPYIDLYSVLIDRPDYYIDDGIHLCEDGYKALADEIYKKINKILL